MDVNSDPKGQTVEQVAQKMAGLFSELNVESADNTETPEGSDSPQPGVQTFKVKVDGEDLDVPLDELLKGYSRTSDYTRKTQKVSEERKAIEAEASRVRVEREQYAQGLELLKSQLAQAPQIDWAKLREEDPVTYAVRKAEDQERKEQLRLVDAERQRVAQLQQAEQQSEFQKFVQAEQARLTDAIPEWKDAKLAKDEKEKIAKFAMNLGYSESDLSQIYDHRAVVALRKAALYDEMMSNAKSQTEKVKTGPKTATPGNYQPQTSKQFAEARNRLSKKGDINSFVAAFNSLNRK